MFVVRAGWLLLVAHLLTLSCALIITSPSNRTFWDSREALKIQWIAVSDDPSNITITLVNRMRNPAFSTILAEGIKSASNGFTADPDASIPDGPAYQIELAHVTNTSNNIMANSEEFTVRDAEAVPPPSTSSGSPPVKVIASIVVVVVVVLVVTASFWFCWFRRRRRQIREQYSSPTHESKSETSLHLGRASPTVSSSPKDDYKKEIEERRSHEDIEKAPKLSEQPDLERQATPPSTATRASTPAPPPSIPPPPPIPETAELPIFITPRSSRSIFNSFRRPRTPAERPRTPAELEVNARSTRSTRPASLNEADLGKTGLEPPSPGRRSKRHSLHHVLHPRKAAEAEEICRMPPRLTDHPALRWAQTGYQDTDKEFSHLPRRSKSKSRALQSFLHLRRYAELEGSTVAVPPLPSATDSKDEATLDQKARRTNRLSLHRLMGSRRLAELEAHTDALPEYSKTDQNPNMVRDGPPPLLPPKDKSPKASLDHKTRHSPSSSTRWAMTPVELDASETQVRPSPVKGGRRSTRRSRLGASTASAYSEDDDGGEWADEADDGFEDVQIHLAKSPVDTYLKAHQSSPPEPVDFLDLTSSTGSEGADSEEIEVAPDEPTASTTFVTPFTSPVGDEGRMDPFLTAEIISAAVEASSSGLQRVPRSKTVGRSRQKSRTDDLHPTVHEMDAIETVIKRRSKRTSHPVGSTKGDASRRRPDFLTFKKQMTEAERRAKMVAKRKSRRRMPKSF